MARETEVSVRTTYTVGAMWLGGNLTPASIGERVLTSLRQFGPLSNAMDNWQLGEGGVPTRLSDAAARMAEVVEHNVTIGDDNRADPDDGYGIICVGSAVPSEFGRPDSINLRAHVGGRFWNRFEFVVGESDTPPDLSLVTYPIYRGVLEVLAANWPCPWALAYAYVSKEPTYAPETQDQLYARLRRPFEVAWVAYLSAPLVKDLVPPPEIAVECTPGGGMILSAVQERLDPANPEHIRRSELLEAIMNERVGRFGRQLKQTVMLPARIGPY